SRTVYVDVRLPVPPCRVLVPGDAYARWDGPQSVRDSGQRHYHGPVLARGSLMDVDRGGRHTGDRHTADDVVAVVRARRGGILELMYVDVGDARGIGRHGRHFLGPGKKLRTD